MPKLAINGGAQAAPGLKDFPFAKLHPEDETAVLEALRGYRWSGLGGENSPNAEFEGAFAAYQDCAYGVTVANGTVSLELALRAGGVQPGDQVLVPALTFVASASSIVSVGAVPVFVDVDPDTAQMSADALADAVGPGARAVIVVHYGGYLADMDAILPVAKRHNLLVVEDCAHAQGSSWRGKKAGSWGDCGSFSFQYTKSLSGGEAGILVTSNEKLFERASLMRNIGRRTGQTTYDHYLSASNWRLSGLLAGLLVSRFRRFPREAEERHKNGEFLAAELDKIPGLRRLPKDDRITQRGYYFLVLDFDAEAFGCSREKFLQALQAEGVWWAGAGYNRPLHKEPAFVPVNLRPLLHPSIEIPDYPAMRFPNAETWAARQVTVGHSFLLGDGTAATQVLDAVAKVKENVAELGD
ncbi:MAG: DegT/DnrJ/EryC1/StrS family aminotransferase [Firmicutes bacterium]|nr:DegT/DnrJ/EryC1/StrS family aminotransferase [Bacillota bacterium]